MLDFRLKENRREAFIRWYVWGLRTTDCDPALGLMKYIFERQELNVEQRLWVCWLYGCTYYLPTAYLIYNEFPDYENVDLDRLTRWNAANYKRLRYQTDTKYNKGHLPAQFASYREVMGASQKRSLEPLLQSGPKNSYSALLALAKGRLHKFGRYTSWFYLQALRECAGLPLEPLSLLLGQDGSESHTNGLCYALGRDELVTTYYEGSQKLRRPAAWDCEQLQLEADMLLAEIEERFPDVRADYFTMETALCSFKKLFRKRQGRYLGYYLDRQAEEIRQLEQDGWNGVDWQLLWDYRAERLRPEIAPRSAKIRPEHWGHFLASGSLQGLGLYEDLAN